MFNFNYRYACIFIIFAFFITGNFSVTHADRIEELREQIRDRNSQLAEIEREIAQFEAQLQKVGTERKTLESAIKTLDISRQRLLTDIRRTQNRIESTGLSIEELSLKIVDTTKRIETSIGATGETLRALHEAERQSLVETFLVYNRLSDFWNGVSQIQQLQTAIADNLIELRELKEDLSHERTELEGRKKELTAFQRDLSGQRQVVERTKNEKAQLLTDTKNTESNYQKLLAEKKARREAFEQELADFEAQLRIAIDPDSFPEAQEGILSWPVDNVFVTQYFGNTKFATQNPQIYNGKGHNGIDLRAGTGTKIKAALSGTVEGVGNTDTVCRNASYGRWILLRHANGLTTIYGHLSSIAVEPGQRVSTGETIGFSGSTGYSTGPHLHFSVLASQGVRIDQLKSRACPGKTYTIPLADLKAYLNPLSYL